MRHGGGDDPLPALALLLVVVAVLDLRPMVAVAVERIISITLHGGARITSWRCVKTP
jgi:hypothetical protein